MSVFVRLFYDIIIVRISAKTSHFVRILFVPGHTMTVCLFYYIFLVNRENNIHDAIRKQGRGREP